MEEDATLTPVLRVKRKRSTPAAPELVVEGLYPPASKRRNILNYFSGMALASEQPPIVVPPRIFQLVKSYPKGALGAAQQPENLMQDISELGSRPAGNAQHAVPSVPAVSYRHVPEQQAKAADGGTLHLFHLYDIAAELGPQTLSSEPIESLHEADVGPAEGSITSAAAAISSPDAKERSAQAESEDEDMYDFYAACPVHEEQADRDVPLSQLPVVKIEDDLWLVNEDNALHSGHDSEDSNAESYYANSYPDEENGSSSDGGSQSEDYGDAWSDRGADHHDKIAYATEYLSD